MYKRIFASLFLLLGLFTVSAQSTIIDDELNKLINETNSIGKPEWRPMLKYVAELHKRSTHAPEYPFDYEWEEIGPGYHYSRAFGHWDIIHATLDVMPTCPTHALHQLLNDVKNQSASGFLPGAIWMTGGISKRDTVYWKKEFEGHPPLWVIAVHDYINQTGVQSVLKIFYDHLIRQITWFENRRRVKPEGFFYNDIIIKRWESGVDEGVRFDEMGKDTLACIDATSHVYMIYKHAALWGKILGMDVSFYSQREKELENFIRNNLYDKETGMFYDSWAKKDKSKRHIVFDSMWPLVVGAASKEEADRYIDNYLLNESVFLTAHPISTVSKSDPKFELRMWRGPTWNSMTYWASRACLNYGRKDAAKIILEKALDATAKQFERTGTIWEFYNSLGGNPEDVKRKPQTPYNIPSKDYLGHNPLIEMTRLYDSVMK